MCYNNISGVFRLYILVRRIDMKEKIINQIKEAKRKIVEEYKKYKEPIFKKTKKFVRIFLEIMGSIFTIALMCFFITPSSEKVEPYTEPVVEKSVETLEEIEKEIKTVDITEKNVEKTEEISAEKPEKVEEPVKKAEMTRKTPAKSVEKTSCSTCSSTSC